ncbi:MAG: hypothetical protein F4241_05000 [Rhodothermaceae bacterium]|nr:hypothetical protein [Rhodothermaceae bacterium]MYH13324.1 hypothetical protein [Rhodothermaceae bacterium]
MANHFTNGNRWCIFIDILGFSRFWVCERGKAHASLRAIMRGIYAIGRNSYPADPKRFFVHQMGDGFAIVSDFGESSLDRPVAIASALMRHISTSGTFAAAAIAEGDFADIRGIYPQEIFSENYSGRVVNMGQGLMIPSFVMGTAFIRAYGVAKEAPPGPFLTVAGDQRDRLPANVECQITSGRKDKSLWSIDWLRHESEHLVHIQQTAKIHIPSLSELQQAIKGYCKHYSFIGDKWRDHLHGLLDIEV